MSIPELVKLFISILVDKEFLLELDQVKTTLVRHLAHVVVDSCGALGRLASILLVLRLHPGAVVIDGRLMHRAWQLTTIVKINHSLDRVHGDQISIRLVALR